MQPAASGAVAVTRAIDGIVRNDRGRLIAALIARLGTPNLAPTDVDHLASVIRDSGVADELEAMIADAVEAGLDCLKAPPLAAAGVAGLRDAASALAWRES